MRINVTGLSENMWKELHEDAINNFIEEPGLRFMVAFIDQYKGFIIEYTLPAYYVDQMTYLIKADGVKEVTTENFHHIFQYGTVKGQHIESLLRLMMGIYAPAFFENTTWPDSILCFNIPVG